MATRVDKTVGSEGLSDLELLNHLRGRAGKRGEKLGFTGLKRSEALADLSDNAEALSNILAKLSVTDTADSAKYGGPFNPSDWFVTRDFVSAQIDKSFLSPLSGVSIGGGSLGSQVPLNPRIRIEDRVGQANSFYGEGSFSGLHSGPDAQFYRSPSPEHTGYVKFNFNEFTGVVTTTSLKGPDNVANITTSSILGQETSVVLEVVSYGPDNIPLSGSGITLRLETGGIWTVETGLAELLKIKLAISSVVFETLSFRLERLYSKFYPPLWFTESPEDSSTAIPGSADDTNTVTSSKIFFSEDGVIKPKVSRGYWFSKAVIDGRWSEIEREYIGTNYVIEDSNMRWINPPDELRSETNNWGIRWDGYLRITPGTYSFQVQTNVSVKIDMDISPTWVNVFNTSTAARVNEDTYVSRNSFDTSLVPTTYKYFTGPGVNDWVGYVPITIRLFHGGPDKAYESETIPSEPNIFIKTTAISSQENYYSGDYSVVLSGTDGNWTLTGSGISNLISIVQDTFAEVTFQLVAQAGNFLSVPISISLSTNGVTLSSSTTGLTAGSYTLRVVPAISSGFSNNLQALWKTRIASTDQNNSTYSYLTSGNYSPDLNKVPFNQLPEWWKVSQGTPYNRTLQPSLSNNPLDGWLENSFTSTLQSKAPGVGLYGNGLGTYSNKPGLIIGEARYSISDPKGSNYTAIRLSPNRLGEGGRLIINAFPVNNSTNTGTNTLGANDLGGDPNHKTIAFANTTSQVAQLYLWTNPTNPSTSHYNKYYTVSNILAVASAEDPTVYGLPAFADPAWLSPITVVATEVANDAGFTTGLQGFVAPLTLIAEKIVVNGYDRLAFSTTLTSILTGGAEVASFSGKFVRFYNEKNIAFQYSFVDTGAGVSFSDTLKITYNTGIFNAGQSEIPGVPSDSVTPFGYDDPAYSTGICYPPYATSNALLTETAVDDSTLYSAAAGNYDVFWGNPYESQLGNDILTITERIEFYGQNVIDPIVTPVTVSYSSYTHRMRIDMPLPNTYDEDVLEFMGNGEKVKDSYFAYVNLN